MLENDISVAMRPRRSALGIFKQIFSEISTKVGTTINQNRENMPRVSIFKRNGALMASTNRENNGFKKLYASCRHSPSAATAKRDRSWRVLRQSARCFGVHTNQFKVFPPRSRSLPKCSFCSFSYFYSPCVYD